MLKQDKQYKTIRAHRLCFVALNIEMPLDLIDVIKNDSIAILLCTYIAYRQVPDIVDFKRRNIS